MAGTPVENKKAVKELGRPREVDLYEEQDYHWPSWKFDMEMEELYRGLHDEYNTLRFPILSPRAFHLDVKELATKAKTREEFHRLLDERSWARFKEVRQALDDLGIDFYMSPDGFVTPPDLWFEFLKLMRARSFSDLIIFLSKLQAPTKDRVAEASKPTSPGPPDVPEPSPHEPPVRMSVSTPEASHSTSSTPPHDPPPPSTPSSRKKTRRQAPSRQQTADDIVKHSLRPRAAGASRRKFRKRKHTQRKRSSDIALLNRYTVQH
ncbi:hypothetical protein F5Y14DRAFT_397173 [Nemania sp. NC0429]|nr:hypothetical protein F5Y14DRAFT_397173 [Nemania sp. NC0429]